MQTIVTNGHTSRPDKNPAVIEKGVSEIGDYSTDFKNSLSSKASHAVALGGTHEK